MARQFQYLILILSLLISGCTGSQVLVDQKYTAEASDHYNLEIKNDVAVPAPEMKMLEQALEGGLREQNIRASENDADRILQVTVKKYHFRSDATRVITGNLTGNDAIVSTVTVVRLEDGKLLGKEEVITHNPTVISKSEDLINAHAKKIISSLLK